MSGGSQPPSPMGRTIPGQEAHKGPAPGPRVPVFGAFALNKVAKGLEEPFGKDANNFPLLKMFFTDI